MDEFEDVYSEEREELVEEGSLDGEDEAFMKGWESALDGWTEEDQKEDQI